MSRCSLSLLLVVLASCGADRATKAPAGDPAAKVTDTAAATPAPAAATPTPAGVTPTPAAATPAAVTPTPAAATGSQALVVGEHDFDAIAKAAMHALARKDFKAFEQEILVRKDDLRELSACGAKAAGADAKALDTMLDQAWTQISSDRASKIERFKACAKLGKIPDAAPTRVVANRPTQESQNGCAVEVVDSLSLFVQIKGQEHELKLDDLIHTAAGWRSYDGVLCPE